jgi:methylenetetrahydrofolate dehydrogenase (NADP+)/methenyltetrahydrofolate cyclohydrolase
MTILDGKKISNDIKDEITIEVNQMKTNGERVPHLAAVLVGDDGASLTYVGSKVRSCERVGFESTLVRLPEATSEDELLQKIVELNENPKIDGFIVQLPLPKHINENNILIAVDPAKDVDGFHPENFGRMALEMESCFTANTIGIIKKL